MAVRMEIIQPIANNRVEVQAEYNGVYTKKFSVEKEKADEFVSSYKSFYNKASMLTTLGTCLMGGIGGVAAGFLTKNLSGWKSWAAIIGGGLIGYTAATIASAKPMADKEKAITEKFGAEVIKNDTPN